MRELLEKKQQEEYMKSRRVDFKAENGSEEYTCFLEKDNTISFCSAIQMGGHFEGGVYLSRNQNTTNKPYWHAVADELTHLSRVLPDYYDKIVAMLCKHNRFSDIVALKIVIDNVGEVYDDVDKQILQKTINNKNLDTHNKILLDVQKELNDAILYINCKNLNEKTKQYEEMVAKEKLKLVEKKLIKAKLILEKQFEVNKNEQANREIIGSI